MAAVRGFQGDASFKDKKRIVATLKHFAAARPAGIGHELRAGQCVPARAAGDLFAPFKECVQKAGAISVMASYNEIDGVPSHANRWLLRDVLRKEWGFKGFVVSDYYAI